MAVSSRARTLVMAAGVVVSTLAGALLVSHASASHVLMDSYAAASDDPVESQRRAVQAKHDENVKRFQEDARRVQVEAQIQTQAQAKAAEERNVQAARAAAAANENPFASTAPLLSVEFPGGTVSEYVQLLRSTSKDPVNVAASEELLSTHIPAISLKSVSLMSALRSLGTIGDGAGMIDVRDLSLLNKTNERVGSPVYEVLWVPRRSNDEASVNTYALFDQLPSLTDEDATRMAETLVSAAQAALTMNGASSNWELKFHRPSRLLLMKGTRSQTEIVSGVVDRMTSGWARDAAQKRVAGGDADAMRRIQELRTELARDIEMHRKAMEDQMGRYEAAVASAKKEGAAVPEMGRTEQMRYQELQQAYSAKVSRLNRLDDQLLTARLGFDAYSNSDARVKELEARVEQLTRQLQQRGVGVK